MNSLLYKIFKIASVAVVFVFLAGCNYGSQFAVNAVAKEPATRAAWLAYWDLEAGQKDLESIGRELNKVSYFGAYFDKNDQLFIPNELSDQRAEHKKKKQRYETYLTFVNDKQNADESVVMKDIEVLRRLFTDDQTMEKHIGEMIALTLQGGYDGIELDYERIWKDPAIGKSFVRFADKLYAEALKNHLKLRIVLEPRTPFSSAGFSKGPEYVVMFYNLYGLHSDAGPKANKDFILKTLDRMKVLPGEKSIALSTGGCMWGDNGEKRFLTETEARTLAKVNDAELSRDEESKCVTFHYEDKGVGYQVWYADIKTLNYWIAIAQEQGYNNISLWRLGGNVALHKLK